MEKVGGHPRPDALPFVWLVFLKPERLFGQVAYFIQVFLNILVGQ